MPDVSRETLERLATYEALIKKWSPVINLVASEDLAVLKQRHVADSQQLVPLIGKGRLTDLGSGGGFPGLVIAASKMNASLSVTLIEADRRKATFLRAAAREMRLTNITVLNQRIEAASPHQADYVTARALAPLPRLLDYVHRHLRPDGTALLMKGARWQAEVDAAGQMWDFTCHAIPSSTDPGATILHVTKLLPR